MSMVEADKVAQVNFYALPGLKFQAPSIRRSWVKNRYQFRREDVKRIMNVVSEFFHVDIEDIKSSCRKREFVWARQVFCFFCLKYTGCTQQEIGDEIIRDRTTVIHAEQTVRDICETDPERLKDLHEIEGLYLNVAIVGKG